MFNYTRNDQILKKTPVTPLPSNVILQTQEFMPTEPFPSISAPVQPPVAEIETEDIEMQPTMGMQPAMGMQPNVTCMYANVTSPTPMPCMCGAAMGMPSAQVDSAKVHDDMEIAYLKKMYPPTCQKIQQYVENELDKYDHELSPIYEMYPSQESIDYMANCIYSDMKDDMPETIKEYECSTNSRLPIGGPFYTLAYALLLNELYRRRTRRRLYPTYYSPYYNYY